MATMPTRIDQELFEAARTAGEVQSRSAAQQLAHWARLGRQLEASPAMTAETIERVLSGQLAYDDLASPFDRAVVRNAWDEQLTQRMGEVDLSAPLSGAGLARHEADDDGNVVARPAAGA
ncbi:MAG: hypothetical protein J7513_14560 [Solirubrobacteraceae bacterium]|nr:hypothetical protein [Solirubrobacteraceae bacterium]